MFAPHNPHRFIQARRTLVAAALACACSDTTGPAQERLVPIEIRAEPDVDTVRLGDSITLTVWADTLAPLDVAWSVEPGGDTVVSASLVFHPPSAGTQFVRARATFPMDREGIAIRRVITPTNSAPSGAIQTAEPNNYRRVPLGDTLVLVAEFTDPDGDSLEARWFAGEPENGGFLGMGDTLRFPAESPGTLGFAVEVRDPAGARAVDRITSEIYDPVTPSTWRVFAGPFALLTTTDAGRIIGNLGQKLDGSNAVCSCPLMAFDSQGSAVWSVPGGSGAVPFPSVGDAVYFTNDAGTLRRVTGTGTVDWSLGGAVLGPIVLPDGSLAVPSTTGVVGVRSLRRVAPNGTVLWELEDSAFSWRADVGAVGPDSAIYLMLSGNLVRVTASGTKDWQLPLGGALAIADDSTILVTGVSLTALRPDGTVRWTRARANAGVAVGTGDIAYTVWGEGGAYFLGAFRTTDGEDLWQVAGVPTGGWQPPVLVADGSVIFSVGTLLLALDAATAAERWRHELAAAALASPLLTDDGLLVVSDRNGYLEGIALGVGPLDAPWPMEWGGNRRLGRRRTP